MKIGVEFAEGSMALKLVKQGTLSHGRFNVISGDALPLFTVELSSSS